MTEKNPESVGASATDLLFDQLDEQFHVRQELMAGIQEQVDFGEVLGSEQFRNASPEVRARLAEKYGFELTDMQTAAGESRVEEPPKEPNRESAADIAEAEPGRPVSAAEVTFPVDLEAELRRKHPRKIIFTGYRLAQDQDGRPKLEETGYYLNRKTKQYEEYRNPPTVQVRFPEELAARLNEVEVRQAVLEFAGRLRKHLGEGGLNLFFDKRRRQDEDEPDQWNPKWKYAPDSDRPNRYREDYLTIGTEPWDSERSGTADVSEVPWNVYQAVEEFRQENPSDTPLSVLARQNPTYGDWYGKAIQAKRDGIITEELAGREFEKLPAGTVAAIETPVKTSEADRPERAVKPRATVARRASRALRRSAGQVGETPPSEAAEAVEAAKLQLDIERLSADARPHIRTALKATREIWKEDPKKQIKEAIRLTTDRLNEEYAREGLIAKGDSEGLTAYAEHMVQLARQEMANLDFLEANSQLPPAFFSLNRDGELEAELGREAWSESLDQRAADLIRQALADSGLDIDSAQLLRLSQTMASAIRDHKQTDFSVLDRDKGRLRLTDWENLKRMILAVCRDFAGR